MKALIIAAVGFIVCLLLITQKVNAQEVFRVDKAVEGKIFVINNNRFTARNDCPNIKRGDPVRFTEGSPNGVCISGVFINLRTGKECSVWCH